MKERRSRASGFSMTSLHGLYDYLYCMLASSILVAMPIFGGALFGPVYWVVNILTGVLSLAFLVFAIVGIINAAQGKAKELPVISKIKILK